MAPSPSEWCNRSTIQFLAFSTARRRTDLLPLRSHHLSNLSKLRKKLCQVKKEGSWWKAGLTPGSQSSSRVRPAGTGRRGLEACTMESEITIARVHEDIWYSRSNGRSAT